ncbi:hypothetical protein QBC40DRAFT_2441 [Triangularia verruculosa]|uniref:Uncharacterized protein n=1 Tax=Triangularia verruculosa TaxID=2587418 RepID=A0AAN7AZC5_9PEZI|nr:hypothetical protein QBC40DRAFT_2441 [Triangularia verruculosa]
MVCAFHIPSALGNLSQWPPGPSPSPILLAHGALLNAAQRAVGCGRASGSAPLSLSLFLVLWAPSLLLHFPTPPPLQTLLLFIQSAFFASPIRRSPLDHSSWIPNHCASRFIPACFDHLCPRGVFLAHHTTIVFPSRAFRDDRHIFPRHPPRFRDPLSTTRRASLSHRHLSLTAVSSIYFCCSSISRDFSITTCPSKRALPLRRPDRSGQPACRPTD